MEVIFRMAGILLIMGSTVWTGATLAAREKYRLRDLGELERGVLLLEGQIAYLSAPLPEVLESVGWKMEGAAGVIFRQAAEGQKETFFRQEDMDALLLFGKTLGFLDKEQQKNSIRLFLRYLESAQEQGRRRLDKNGRLYYGMGVLSGLMLVTVLL